MKQLHKKFNAEQVKILFTAYQKGHISRKEIEKTLGIGKTRFFALLKEIKKDPQSFSLKHQRHSRSRLSVETEEQIKFELLRERELIQNKDLPISGYNYAALNDRLKKEGVRVSTTTIINRAKELDCYLSRKRKRNPHDREVITAAAGDLIQHDASWHKWSPYAEQKWTLITSLDDYSRMLLYADFVESETSWAHIQAAQSLVQSFGVPHQYYVDNLRVFRFVQHRDSVWKNLVLGTDDVNTQWRQALALLNIQVIYALSPQAKGKIERPYRWLQDRIVRACALDHVSSMTDARQILREEVHRYNYLQLHSTTKEIPAIRFEKAKKDERSLFRPFVPPSPFSSIKDVFCLRFNRIANGYRKISLFGLSFQIPGVNPYEDVEMHLIPDLSKELVEIRFWAHDCFIHSLNLPFSSLKKSFHL